MIAVDSSAIIAILEAEPEADEISRLLLSRPGIMSTFSVLECSAVLMVRRGADSLPDLERLIDALGVATVPFDGDVARLAVDAYRRWGKGLGRRPWLNLGDCVAYATARHYGLPLLFKGDDFGGTDIEPVLSVRSG